MIFFEEVYKFLFLRGAFAARQVTVLVTTELFGSAHAKDFERFFVEGRNVGVFERRTQYFFSGSTRREIGTGFCFPDSAFGFQVRLEVIDIFRFGDGVIIEEEDFFTDVFSEFIGPLFVELEVRATLFEGGLTPGVFLEFFGLFFVWFLGGRGVWDG